MEFCWRNILVTDGDPLAPYLATDYTEDYDWLREIKIINNHNYLNISVAKSATIRPLRVYPRS